MRRKRLLTTSCVPVACVTVPLTGRAPVPPRFREPAFRTVPPEYVAVPATVRLPAPLLVSA